MKYEFQWLHFVPGSRSVIFLARAECIADLIDIMHKTNFPKPLVSKMKTCLDENDAFSYLLSQWHVHKVAKGSNASRIKALLKISDDVEIIERNSKNNITA